MLKKLKNLLLSEVDPAYAKRAEFIFQEIENKKPHSILDVGCGRGFYLYAISLYSFPKKIYGIEINKEYIEKAKEVCRDKRVSIQQGNVYKLPYKDKSIDCIIFSEVLEHLVNEKKALLELKRVLKPKGVIILTVPNYDFPFFWDPINWVLMHFFNTHINKNRWWLAGIWAGHERLYKEEEIKKKVLDVGFRIIASEKVVHFCIPFTHFILYGIGKNLVEKLHMNSFNRFSFNQTNKFSIVSLFFRLPQLFERKKNSKKPSSVNILLKLKHVY